MYRLLIVDDEQIIVEGLYRLFNDITRLDLDIYRAYNGSQAMEILNSTRIDIVITDIRMPGMDGIQLLESIKNLWPDCKVIFLTGYNDFDYVYTAIQHNGVNYILKTEKDSKVIEAVENAINEIQNKFVHSELVNKAREQFVRTLPVMQKEYLTSLLTNNKLNFTTTQQLLDELQIPLKAEYPVILLIGCIDNLSQILSMTERLQWVFEVKLLVEEQLFVNARTVYVFQEDSYLVWIVQQESFISLEKTILFIREKLELAQRLCMESLKASISFVLESSGCEWGVISEKYFEMRQLLNSHIVQEKGVIITGKIIAPVIETDSINNPLNAGKVSQNLYKISAMENYLDRGQRIEFFKLFQEVTEPIQRVKNMRYIPALEIYLSLALMFLSFINRWDCTKKLNQKMDLIKLTKIEKFESWGAAEQYLKEMAEIILDIQESEKHIKDGDTISMIQQYIKEHLTEDISLPKLGEMAFFNPFYLSRLFKQMTGVTIKDYIQQERVNKAKELLGINSIKIQEISALVGFEFPAYFSKIFKKMTNMTPHEYRESLITKR